MFLLLERDPLPHLDCTLSYHSTKGTVPVGVDVNITFHKPSVENIDVLSLHWSIY
jgi:hypothetical protein